MRKWMGGVAGALVALSAASVAAQEIGSMRVAVGLASPTYATYAPNDPTRLYITQRFGVIEILDLATGELNPTPFIDIPEPNNEGLQGLAFHPQFQQNGYFFVHYYSQGVSYIRRYTASSSDSASTATALTVLSLPQTFANHNGGWIGFGPDDYLYVPFGDGGSQYDPEGNGQNTSTFKGTILRIDVDGDDFPGDPDVNYAIPPTNPFVSSGGAPEVWLYGFRNPFRSSFDRLTGDLYIADVGQDTWEEINIHRPSDPAAQNYGWRLREGFVETPTGGIGGELQGAIDPIHVVGRADGQSITGGYVYRGPIQPLRGQYFFADYQTERIWSIRYEGGPVDAGDRIEWTSTFVPDVGSIDQIVGFGEDLAGNLYIVDLGGEVFQVVGPLAVPALPGMGLGLALGAALVLSLQLLRRRGR